MAAEAPGAAFLQRRLARARAVPPAERSPEVQAFITSVELGRQACELLPLQQSGEGGEPRPALPLGAAATTRRVLRAVLTVVQAARLCSVAVFDPSPEQHIRAYLTVLQQEADGGSFAVLASTLLNYTGAFWSSQAVEAQAHLTADAAAQAQLAADTTALLRCPAFHVVLAQQLEALAACEPGGSLPVTKQQLEAACHRLSILTATQQALGFYDPTTGVVDLNGMLRAVAAAKATVQTASARWLQLEPDSLTAIGTIAEASTTVAAGQWTPADLQRLLHAMQLARQQRSVYWAFRCAALALPVALHMPLQSCPASIFRGLLDSYSQLELEAQGCKAVLPQSWVQALEAVRQPAAEATHHLRLRLTALEGRTCPATLAAFMGPQAQVHQLETQVSGALQLQATASICSGCGQRAVGLRACARCRTVRYCSSECQAAHWPQHRRECRRA